MGQWDLVLSFLLLLLPSLGLNDFAPLSTAGTVSFPKQDSKLMVVGNLSICEGSTHSLCKLVISDIHMDVQSLTNMGCLCQSLTSVHSARHLLAGSFLY